MEAYPPDYVVHNLPLVLLSGLEPEGQNDAITSENTRTFLGEGGFRLRTSLPPVSTPLGTELRKVLLRYDGSDAPWHSRQLGPAEHNVGVKIRSVGRAYTLPPRKAPPPPRSPRLMSANRNGTPPPRLVLHSTLSPLTPSSPLYADGIMTSLWVTKHQHRLPSAYISFFALVCDSQNKPSEHDGRIISEINSLRSVFSQTNYKTRLVVALVGDGNIDPFDLEERLTNLRRAASLEGKNLYFLPFTSSVVQIDEFSKTLLSNLSSTCIEYYRDLSKHARRKRNKNTIPQPTVLPTTGTTQTLPLQGWGVRYEFKFGVLAEFRQEMDAACRNYEAAYEILFSTEVFESIAAWSSRFTEARLLSDVICIRIIRCLLWSGQSSTAIRWWVNHKKRIKDILDRKGKGSGNYGWEAWQSIWARTMADLIVRAEVIPALLKENAESLISSVHLGLEKNSPQGEKWTPWESLHHEGYWLNLAQRHVRGRRVLALQIPEADRILPGKSPASAIASKAHLYETYLTLQPYQEQPVNGSPGYDYTREILKVLDDAIRSFTTREQMRMVDVLNFKKATELIRETAWGTALSVMKPLWRNGKWRQGGWWMSFRELGHAMRICTVHLKEWDSVAQLEWELKGLGLAARSPSPSSDTQQPSDSRVDVSMAILDITTAVSSIVPAFVFASPEGHVGEQIQAQLSLHYYHHHGVHTSSKIKVKEIKVVFEGNIKPIHLNTKDVAESDFVIGDRHLVNVILHDSLAQTPEWQKQLTLRPTSSWTGETDLSPVPGGVKVFSLKVLSREAGDVSVASITVLAEQDEQIITLTVDAFAELAPQWWALRQGKLAAHPIGRDRDVTLIKVLPKPPLMEISIPNIPKSFYTDEEIELEIEAVNHEEEAVDAKVNVRLISPSTKAAIVRWADQDHAMGSGDLLEQDYVQVLEDRALGKIGASQKSTRSIILSGNTDAVDHELEITISYALISSPDVPLVKSITVDIPIVRPFEASYLFHPRVHDESWPNFFTVPVITDESNQATGLKQQYLVSATLASFALDIVQIQTIDLQPIKLVGGAVCSSGPGILKPTIDTTQDRSEVSTLKMKPEEMHRYVFDLTIRKLALGDRHPVGVDLSLQIQWQRHQSDRINISTLLLPRFLAPSSEPRVLLRVHKDLTIPTVHRLTYTLENPSMHFLTFNLTMESSEDFAFSGPKLKAFSLTPISRYDVEYRILPNKLNDWIKIHLEVVDAYFGHTLQIQPAEDGIKVDKQGNVLVWIS